MKKLPELEQFQTKAITFSVVMTIVAIFSATVLGGIFSSPATYQDSYQKLDEKRDNVMALAASSAGASALITLLPDDTCTPIANELTEISKGFSIVLAALLLEKHLLTLLGFGFFTLVIPLCCVLLVAARFMQPGSGNKLSVQHAAFRLFSFGLILYVAIPISVFVSNKIDEGYQTSIDATVGSSEQMSAVVEESGTATESEDSRSTSATKSTGAKATSTKSTAAKSTSSKTSTAESEEADGPFAFLQQQLGNLQSAAGSAIKTATGAVDWAKEQVGNYVELFAVMIVTSVVIPVAVPLVLYLVFKILFGQQPIIVPQSRALSSASFRPVVSYKSKDE